MVLSTMRLFISRRRYRGARGQLSWAGEAEARSLAGPGEASEVEQCRR